MAVATAQPVTDIKAYLETRRPVPSYEQEEALFVRLPITERARVRRLQAAVIYVRNLTAGKHPMKVQPACRKALAIYPEFQPLKTFRGKYDAWLKEQDWLKLANLARAGAAWQTGQRGLPDVFLDHVAARMGDFKRGDAGEQAIISIHRQWRTGRNHRGELQPIPGYEAAWDQRNVALLPDGWHPTNIRKQLRKRGKFSKAVKALRHEGIAAARAFVPQVHSTRKELRFMEEVQFDDVRCDFRVLDTVTGQICDLWLLVARDRATTMLLGFGMRPALAREDGTQSHLKLQDMKQLFGWLLETYGLPAWTMTAKIEHGTATLSEAVKASLEEMLGDRISVSYSSMIGGKSSAGYAERALGNSRGKAMLESLNRLMHMMASHLPGQIGAHYGKRPAEAIARETEAQEIWRTHKPEDREQLAYPVLTLAQARTALFEIFRQQNQRTDHDCEGFDKVIERYDAGTQSWLIVPPGEAVPPDCQVRARMESPIERAARLLAGCEPFSRVSPEIIASLYAHTHRRRPVEANGEITLTHEGKLLRFGPPGPEFALVPETKCLCYFNPHDPRFLTLTDGRGGILGTWLRIGLINNGDRDALAAAIRHSATALNAAKDRANDLAAGEQVQLQAMRDHNAGFVAVAEAQPARQTLGSPIASTLTAVKAEKAITAKQKKDHTQARNLAREALRNLA